MLGFVMVLFGALLITVGVAVAVHAWQTRHQPEIDNKGFFAFDEADSP